MRRVGVELGSRRYDVVVGFGVLAEAAPLLAGHPRVAVVSQEAVVRHWAAELTGPLAATGVQVELFLMGDGEDAKSLATVEDLCRRFAAWGLLRGDAVVALGGGVVGDTAGFTAAAYHRGVACLQVPTTMLGQVDAAIGGKTGVNLPEGKNLVGAFHQPAGVVADVATLATLPEREYRAGLGEVAKYALMSGTGPDPGMFATGLTARLTSPEGAAALLARDPETLVDVVTRCAAIKAAVVAADECERTGLRATLNYGHTLAHALETAGRYGLLHGEAVAVGLVFASELAGALGRLDPQAVGRTRDMLTALGLPVAAPHGVAAPELLTLMRRDKKAAGGLTFVLPAPGGGPLERVDDPPAAAVETALAAVGVGR
ncbi:MAG: 3-dehydroquinate synthase [Actinomycetota bacterium]|nr:3-dehydroquinate synthase [Actinomycetota bacterium]